MVGRGSNVIYVGNLPLDVKEREVEDLFKKYGYIRKVELRTPMRPPAYCFVEFDDPRDADDAITGRDGYEFAGDRLRVEASRGGGPPPSFGSGGGSLGGNSGSRYGGGGGGGSGYRVIVEGLPRTASWQDLKDHFRPYARPVFSNVVRERGRQVGIVEFATTEDVKYVIRKLDNSRFRNIYQEAVVRVYEDGDVPPRRRSRSRSRSRSPRRSLSRSRSRSRGRRSRSKSRSRSRSRGRRGRSDSRSPSRSRRARSPSSSPSHSPSGSRSPPPSSPSPRSPDSQDKSRSPKRDKSKERSPSPSPPARGTKANGRARESSDEPSPKRAKPDDSD